MRVAEALPQRRAVWNLTRATRWAQLKAGDLVLFGAYDGYDIISLDDQVGARAQRVAIKQQQQQHIPSSSLGLRLSWPRKD